MYIWDFQLQFVNVLVMSRAIWRALVCFDLHLFLVLLPKDSLHNILSSNELVSKLHKHHQQSLGKDNGQQWFIQQCSWFWYKFDKCWNLTSLIAHWWSSSSLFFLPRGKLQLAPAFQPFTKRHWNKLMQHKIRKYLSCKRFSVDLRRHLFMDGQGWGKQ